MDIMDDIISDALVLIPALYVVGAIIKRIPNAPDWIIPFVLLALGITGAVGIMGMTADAVMQGVLVTGAAVLVNQGIKQVVKRMEDVGAHDA